MIDKIGKFWVIMKPSKSARFTDILIEATVMDSNFRREEDIHLITQDSAEASEVAQALIDERNAKLKALRKEGKSPVRVFFDEWMETELARRLAHNEEKGKQVYTKEQHLHKKALASNFVNSRESRMNFTTPTDKEEVFAIYKEYETEYIEGHKKFHPELAVNCGKYEEQQRAYPSNGHQVTFYYRNLYMRVTIYHMDKLKTPSKKFKYVNWKDKRAFTGETVDIVIEQLLADREHTMNVVMEDGSNLY